MNLKQFNIKWFLAPFKRSGINIKFYIIHIQKYQIPIENAYQSYKWSFRYGENGLIEFQI